MIVPVLNYSWFNKIDAYLFRLAVWFFCAQASPCRSSISCQQQAILPCVQQTEPQTRANLPLSLDHQHPSVLFSVFPLTCRYLCRSAIRTPLKLHESLGILWKCRFWLGRFKVWPETPDFWSIPRQCQCSGPSTTLRAPSSISIRPDRQSTPWQKKSFGFFFFFNILNTYS